MSVISSSGSSYSVAAPGPTPPQGLAQSFQPLFKVPNGTPLVNGTPILGSWTAPNDGAPHAVWLFTFLAVTVLEVGGQIVLNYKQFGGATNTVFHAGAQAAGNYAAGGSGITVDPGQTVSLAQNTALTGGAATIGAILFGG